MIEIVSFVLGPVGTNAYLIADSTNGSSAVIDPAWDGHIIVAEAKKRKWSIEQIWITHGHFDHFAGVKAIVDQIAPKPKLALHPEDLPLWQMQGGAPFFGMHIDPMPLPDSSFSHGQILELGGLMFEVKHTPGHSPGHVVFYCADEKITFCGDVIFMGGIGRTDLPGGSFPMLMHSIRTQILSLPDATRLLSGHGPETTVGDEKRQNPFLTESFQF